MNDASAKRDAATVGYVSRKNMVENIAYLDGAHSVQA
jgi:hypothetical protein